MKIKTLLFFSTLLFSGFLYGQTCCSGGIPLSNNIGLDFLNKGSFQLGVHYDYNNLNTLNNGTEKLDDNSRLRITHSVLINAGYSISENFSVEGLFTWVNQRRNITQFGNSNLDQSSGMGDAVFLAKYQFPDLISQNSSLSVGLGTKIPFGSSTETNDLGIVLNADLQPGSNAWDIIYWSSYSKSLNSRPSMAISVRLIYRATGTNNSYLGNTTYKFGNELLAFASIGDQFVVGKSFMNPSLSVKYRKAVKDKIGGFDLENTGGNWMSIIPGIALSLSTNMSFLAKAEIPLHSDVQGTQLTPTYRLTAGILLKLTSKQLRLN